ncbi:MAG: tRNA (N6-threonylcarbamoyladenosine(37)-N6)-methyltransferase TrmO [Candidatus Saliniplasma sp.]
MAPNITYEPIGTVHSPYKDIEGMPIQPTGAKGVKGILKLKEEYTDGLKDLDGFSHIIILYHFHLSEVYSLTVEPFLDKEERGLFATRAPKRPNPIGLSIVKLLDVEGNTLEIEDVDVLDGTPLLDIKPYVPEFDHREVESIGWLGKNSDKVTDKRSDDRFR